MLPLQAPYTAMYDTTGRDNLGGELHPDTAEPADEFTGAREVPVSFLMSRVLSATKTQSTTPDQTPGGVWEGTPQPSPPSCMPVAEDYTQDAAVGVG